MNREFNAADSLAAKKSRSAKSTSAERTLPRIRQASQRILTEVGHVLKAEPVPRKRLEAHERQNTPLFGLELALAEAEREELVEIIDAADCPLALMIPGEALHQKLRFRMIAVAPRMAGGEVFLLRRGDKKSGRPNSRADVRPDIWDIATGSVRAGEARDDAAARLLRDLAGIEGVDLRQVAVADASAGFTYNLTLYVADLPRGFTPWSTAGNGAAMDRDELEGVLKALPEMFSKEVIWAAGTGLLFSRGSGRRVSPKNGLTGVF